MKIGRRRVRLRVVRGEERGWIGYPRAKTGSSVSRSEGDRRIRNVGDGGDEEGEGREERKRVVRKL